MSRKKLLTTDNVLHALLTLSRRNKHGIPPTIRELQVFLGVGSTRTVLRYLRELEEEGRIIRWHGARGIMVDNTDSKKGS